MYKPISYPVLSVIIHSHASKKKWHSVFSNGNKIGGRWSSSEALKHINTLELQARAMIGLKYFAEQKSDTYPTAVAFVYQQHGGISFLRTRRNSSGFVGLVY